MRSLRLHFAILAVLACAIPHVASAQVNVNEEQGLKPYESFHGGDLDSVSLTNGSVVHHIPLVCFPQRGSLNLCFEVYSNTKTWQPVNACVSDPNEPSGWDCSRTKWEPLPRGGMFPVSPAGIKNPPNTVVDGAYVAGSLDWWLESYCQAEPPDPNMPNQLTYDGFENVAGPDGNVHSFGSASSTNGCPYSPRSLDATGMLHPDPNTIIMANGTRFSYPGRSVSFNASAPNAVTDANGNQITINSSTGAYTDTMGRVIPAPPGTTTTDLSSCPAGTVSASLWTVPGVAGVNGSVRTFKFCYSNFTIFTNFQQGGINEYPSTNTSLLSAIVLPDLTLWTFSYDNYGDVTAFGFPTGGSITYTYDMAPVIMGPSRVVTSRIVNANDGNGGHTWSYSYSAQLSGNPASYSGKAIVTSPDGNDAVHTISSVVPGSWSSLYDTQVQYYQGSQSGGTLLKTVSTQYSAILNPVSPDQPTAINVVPAQVTTSWPGGKTSMVVNTWDSGTTETVNSTTVPIVLGSLLQKDEKDFSNNLVRSTLTHYLWQDNSTYLNNNLLGPLVSTTVKDGAGNQMAKTTFGTDEVAVTPSGITTSCVSPPAGGNIRGNPTTVSHWLNTTNSFVPSTATYFDTGMMAVSTDPLNHVTSHNYSSAFAGAYMTQTNFPDTQMPDTGAPVVHHVTSGNYDFNTGLLTSFTDENSQTYTYTYDIMLRLTHGNHPDGGQSIFTYPDPNTVTRQRLMTTGNYEGLYTAKFDGLGRSYQTQQVTPSGTMLIDTTYDSVGRESTISNPYYSGSNHGTDPTYGIVTTQYDALSRVVKSTKQDGSAASIAYNDNCTTTTDEAGKQRKVCADALGRMIEVDEPNPSAAATSATGWVSVSGSEQSANSQPATSGSGSITISGTEQSACNYIRNVCHVVYDHGTVTIGVGTYPAKSYSYGQNDNPTTVAAGLALLFHNDGSSPVDATSSGAVVTLTARATGASTNYSFTTSSATTDSQCIYFCDPSFFASPASGALSGGQNASTTPDTGTVTATINGTAYSVSYGSGDTSSSVASRLATAISAGSYANAAASGGTVNLTSKTIGTAGDYSLSASYTWNNGVFTNPSFTTSNSGSIGGALDASGLNNNPYVTLYQYDTLNNLLCVHQKATDTTPDVACTGSTPPSAPASWHQRFFTYDSLSRLLTAANPEAGQITYNYDNNGRLTSKVEPAPNQTGTPTVTITYAYDNLNRLTDKTYSDATQNSSYRYDYSTYLGQTFQYPIGREVATTAASQSIKNFTSYDKMGRVAQTTECIPSVTNCQTFTVSYDLLGDLTQIGYPANSFAVNYQYDSAARLINATDSNNVIYANVVDTSKILASGAINEFVSPNFNSYKFHTDLNNRLQPTEIWAGASQGSGVIFDKQYTYNAPNTSQMNNGNIYIITNVKDSTRTQTLTYDALNRLASAHDGTHWGNTYSYDAWGNLQKIPGSPAGENFQHAADNNNHLVGYSYDAAGSMTNDGATAYVFDAENRITSATANSTTTTYTYDADGRRVKKSSGTNYWYGPGGNVLCETDSSGNWTNYIFFGGQRLARNIPQPSPNPADIKYYVSDHLHSTAMFVDKSGSIVDDNDFYPWGGIVSGVGSTSSTNHYKFTGKERDGESGLDDFGARYYSNTIGRFMGPDWAANPTTVPYAEFGDPQSLNLYAYVRNSPIIRVDGDGHNIGGVMEARSPMMGCVGCDGFNQFEGEDGGTWYDGYGYVYPIYSVDAVQNGQSLPQLQEATPAPEQHPVRDFFEKLDNVTSFNGWKTDAEVAADQAAKDAQFRAWWAKEHPEWPYPGLPKIGIVYPIGGSTSGAAQSEETLFRYGGSKESAARLARKAAEAEASSIKIHGVSVTARVHTMGESRSAIRAAVERLFNVHNTGSDPLHRTIELPKPVTERIAEAFNALFGGGK